MKCSVFGGSFDPPHLGHRTVVQFFLEHDLVDKVWLMPTRQHPFAKQLTPAADRLAMLTAWLDAERADWKKDVVLSTLELDSSEPSYSFRTLETLSQQQPQVQWSWIIGSDQVASFPKWYHAEELLQKFPMWVYPRAGVPTPQLLPGMEWVRTQEISDVSSTTVRATQARHQPLTELVMPAVAQYISDHYLYS